VFGDGGAELRRLLKPQAKPKPQRVSLPAGSRLQREWRGVMHEVQVTGEGLVHQGAVYANLSQVARAITGVRWNGPRFFGLRAPTP
jgi:hypothetical protein